MTDISDIGWYRYDFANRKSIGQKIEIISKKSSIFRRNIEKCRYFVEISKNVDISSKYRACASRACGIELWEKIGCAFNLLTNDLIAKIHFFFDPTI